MKKLVRTLGVLALAVPFLAVGSSAMGADHEFAGSKSCRKCHIKEQRSWADTKMANAFEILKPGERAEAKQAAGLDPQMDYTKDAECVSCHVTGYGEPGGFVDIETTPDLAGVGCESCHGAGGTYIQDEYMSLKNKEYKRADIVAVGMTDQITAETCAGCHNNKSPFVGDDYVFDFETKKQEGTHEKFPLKFEH